MASTARATRTGRDRLVVGAMVLAAVLIATPGVHLFEVWLAHAPAVLVSHGLALLVLAAAVLRWRRGGRRPDAPAA